MSPERRFSSIVCRALGWHEVNLGLGGTTVTGRDDAGQVVDLTSGVGRVPEVLEAEPDHVLILHGANDFAQSRPLGEPRLFRQGTFLWDYDTMLRGLLDGLGPDQVSVCTCPYRSDAETPNALGLTLVDYNRVVREAGERYGLCVLDAYGESGIWAGNWGRLFVGRGAPQRRGASGAGGVRRRVPSANITACDGRERLGVHGEQADARPVLARPAGAEGVQGGVGVQVVGQQVADQGAAIVLEDGQGGRGRRGEGDDQ